MLTDNMRIYYMGFPGGSEGKASTCIAGDLDSIPGSGRFPWRRKWHPTPVFLPGKSHGQRSLVGYSPWGHKESDTTEWLHFQRENRASQVALVAKNPPTNAGVKVAQPCLTLCDPMDCSLPQSSVHGILQARRLEWAVPFFRGSSQSRDWTQVSHITGRFFTS